VNGTEEGQVPADRGQVGEHVVVVVVVVVVVCIWSIS
jgi:hypothetical protein